jgi:sortase A
MRRAFRVIGLALIGVGVLALLWVLVVWQWNDPFTGLYTRWEQHQLSHQYSKLAIRWQGTVSVKTPVAHPRRKIAQEAAAYRRDTHAGEAIGRIVVPRLGLNMVLVDGTDHDSLTKGPGRDLRTYMPGQERLVYIAGHRTTYLAPFAHIDSIRVGDPIRLEMPYATFTYRAVRHEIVPADDLAMLDSPDHELLRLQACHPRFFATHRYIVDARLVGIRPTNGKYFEVSSASESG